MEVLFLKGIILERNSTDTVVSLPNDSTITIPIRNLNGRHYGDHISQSQDNIAYISNSKYNNHPYLNNFI